MRRRVQGWQILAGVLPVFWIVFAFVLILSEFPFLVVSIALTTVAVLSGLVTALAWAFQNDW